MKMWSYSLRLILKKTVFVVLICLSFQSIATEIHFSHPGTRAAGLAGAFSAQGDDSSAIWYNPGSLVHYDFIQQDLTLDYGHRIINEISNSSPKLSTENYLKFAAFYKRSPTKLLGKSFGLGVAYFSPYKLRLFVDAPQSLVNENAFGAVTAEYHQLSPMINVSVTPSTSIGVTFDVFWLNIDCLTYNPCVDYGPTGIASSFGLLHELVTSTDYSLRLSATWHLKANLGYSSTPNSGIGTVLVNYLPSRPDSKTLGLNWQVPTSKAVINSNIVLEKVSWSDTISKGKSLDNYINLASGVEFLSQTNAGKSYSVRMGGKIINNEKTQKIDKAIATVGFGYEVIDSNILDISIIYEKFRGYDDDLTAWSISYSWQK